MKKKELEVIGKRLLPMLPGFSVKGDLIFAVPIGHTLRAICFDQAVDPRAVYVEVFFQPLFVPSEVVYFNLGWRLGGQTHTWNVDRPNLVEELGDALRRGALPFLSRIRSPLDVAEVGESLGKSGDVRAREAIAYAYARAGETVRGIRALDNFIDSIDAIYPWQQEMLERARLLRSLLAFDPAAAVEQLQKWEVETARNLGLEEFYETSE